MKNIFIALVLLGTTSAFAETQFICTFGSEVRLSRLDQENPKPIVDKKSSKYTFMVNNDGTLGSYINLQYGQALPINVYFNGRTVTFIEKNQSNNLFTVTAFLDKLSNGAIPAVFNQNGWTTKKDEPEFHPYTSLGSCLKIDK